MSVSIRSHIPHEFSSLSGIDNGVFAASLVDGLMADKHDGGRIEGDIVELREGSEVIETVGAGCRIPSNRPRDHEGLEGVMR